MAIVETGGEITPETRILEEVRTAPRLGGDLRGPPHLPNSPVRAFYQDVFRLATPSVVETGGEITPETRILEEVRTVRLPFDSV
jgi:hypothetical protein